MKKIFFLLILSVCFIQVCLPLSEDYYTFLGLGRQFYFGSDFETGLSLWLKTIYNLAIMVDVIWSRMYCDFAEGIFTGPYRWATLEAENSSISSSDWIFYHQEVDYNIEVAYYFLNGFFQPYLAMGPYLKSVLPPKIEVLQTYPDFNKEYNDYLDKQNMGIGLTIKAGFDFHIPAFKYISLGTEFLLRLDQIFFLFDNIEDIEDNGFGYLAENIFITINLFGWL